MNSYELVDKLNICLRSLEKGSYLKEMEQEFGL